MAKPRIEQFKQNLRNGAIKFTYKKKDGTIRQAVGTLDKRLLPQTIRTWKRKTNRRIPRNSVVYYDMTSQGIRSFKDYLLQKVDKHLSFSEYLKGKNKTK